MTSAGVLKVFLSLRHVLNFLLAPFTNLPPYCSQQNNQLHQHLTPCLSLPLPARSLIVSLSLLFLLRFSLSLSLSLSPSPSLFSFLPV